MEFRENEVFEVAPGVFIRNAVDNCVWADLGSGVVVVDTLEDPALAAEIPSWVEDTVGKPIRWVINTHWDADHIAGNPALAAAGATVIAHRSTAPRTTERNGGPNVTYTDCYVLQGEGRQAQIEWLGGTHTPADSAVYFPWARTLHVADLFGWGLAMQRGDTPEKVARTREVLGRLLSYDADVVLCGHGPVLSSRELRRYLAYFNELVEVVPRLKREGKSLPEIQQAYPPPDDMRDWWRFVDWKHERNVERMAEAL